MTTKTPATSSAKGFSLVELMVSMLVLSSLLVMFVGLLDQTQKSWDFAQGQISQFREARVAFDLMTKNLSQATLNAYYEQIDEDGNGVPEGYEIFSELHFKITPTNSLNVNGHTPGYALFFQAPLGTTGNRDYVSLSNTLAARGYYVQFNSDAPYRPPFVNNDIPPRYRYRLMEYTPPSELNEVYLDFVKDIPPKTEPDPEQFFGDWYSNRTFLSRYSRPVAENIVMLIFSPREAFEDEDRAVRDIAPRFVYDSEWPNASPSAAPTDPSKRFLHRLPPLVKVVMMAVDETTAIRLEDVLGEREEFIRPYLNGKFGFADKLDTDIEDLIGELNADNLEEGGRLPDIRYKIFSTTVSIAGAKWETPPDSVSSTSP